ncbi:hypothetical protein [Pseudorhodobacter aquimaris]|uniref:hypothetical protein n=1 Tax=Pseudorhodobacter aquimaris TaxID=687412 RepID=UPI000A9AF615|nr:hypothetical protein [Pseudorhodobacter aquimaris]
MMICKADFQELFPDLFPAPPPSSEKAIISQSDGGGLTRKNDGGEQHCGANRLFACHPPMPRQA